MVEMTQRCLLSLISFSFTSTQLPRKKAINGKCVKIIKCTVTKKGGNIPPWGGMQQLFHPHVTKGGEKGGKLIFSTLT